MFPLQRYHSCPLASGKFYSWSLALVIGLCFGWNGSGASAFPQKSDTAYSAKTETLEELIEQNQKLLQELQTLREEIAYLEMELKKVQRERDGLNQFMTDHDTYGTDYEQYIFFKEQAIKTEQARRAAQAKAEREAKRRRMQELREQRKQDKTVKTQEEKEELEVKKRFDQLRRAGYTQIGDSVFVGQMGYAYNTTKKREIRYSPWLERYYLDEDEDIDYSTLRVSGSIVHAGDGDHNVAIAIAFFDSNDGQIGQTTIQIDGARSGVPYPFTSEITMAANRAFKSYNAWVLYIDPIVTLPTGYDNPEDSEQDDDSKYRKDRERGKPGKPDKQAEPKEAVEEKEVDKADEEGGEKEMESDEIDETIKQEKEEQVDEGMNDEVKTEEDVNDEEDEKEGDTKKKKKVDW